MARVDCPTTQSSSQGTGADGRSPGAESDTRPWFAVQTKHGKEGLVISRLAEQDIPHYRPMLLVHSARGARRQSLFPNYLFARIGSVEDSIRVRYTWGVKDVIGYTGSSCPVGEEVIDIIRGREAEDGCIRVSKVFRFREEDRVRLAGGAFHGLEAIFRKYLPARDRIQVLVRLMGRPVLMELNHDRASPVL